MATALDESKRNILAILHNEQTNHEHCRAERNAAREEAMELRVAATEFANTMAALSPIWNMPMRQAWDKLFAVINKE